MPRWSILSKGTCKRAKSQIYLCFSECEYFRRSQRYVKSRAEQNKRVHFLCRDGVSYLKVRVNERKAKFICVFPSVSTSNVLNPCNM